MLLTFIIKYFKYFFFSNSFFFYLTGRLTRSNLKKQLILHGASVNSHDLQSLMNASAVSMVNGSDTGGGCGGSGGEEEMIDYVHLAQVLHRAEEDMAIDRYVDIFS